MHAHYCLVKKKFTVLSSSVYILFVLGEPTPKSLSILRIFSVILNAMKITGQEQAVDIFARFVSVSWQIFRYIIADKFHFICFFNASLRGVRFQNLRNFFR